MLTVLRVGRYRFYFFSNESEEPPHIHVKAGDDEAKYWVEPIGLSVNHGFNAKERNEIEQLVDEHQEEFLEAWNEYFS
jgi:hypothetical protein